MFLTLKFFALRVNFSSAEKDKKIDRGRMKMTIKAIEQSTFILNRTGANLEQNHIVFTVERLVNKFWNHFEHLFHKPQTVGRPKKYKPPELLGYYILCSLRSVTSCRKMADILKNNDESLNYILKDKKPSKSTISKFKTDYELMIVEFFYFIVNIGLKLDLIGNEVIGIDGTFIQANAGINNRASRKELELMEKTLKNLTENEQNELKNFFDEAKKEKKTPLVKDLLKKFNKPSINLLKKSIKSKETIKNTLSFLNEMKKLHSPETDYDINLNDPESRFMKNKKGISCYNYNLQVATDDKNHFIISMDLNIDANDRNQLIPMIESSIMSLGSKPKFFTVDNGYYNDQALYYCLTNEINIIIPDQTEAQRNNDKPSKKLMPKKDFVHDRISDTFMCPFGSILTYQSKRRMNNKLWNVYSTDDCLYCEIKEFCTPKKTREIMEIANPLKQYLKDAYYSEKGQQVYKRRGPITESQFGLLKAIRNFPGLKRKGVKKSRIDLLIEGICHNIKIIHKNIDLSKITEL